MIILRQKNYSNRYTRALAGINKNVLRKSPMQAKRSAVKTQNKALETKAKLIQTAETAAMNPGLLANQAVEATLRHPITVGSNVVGKVTMVTNPTTLGLIPMGTIGTAAEAGLRKWSPRYARVTDKLANKYHGSALSRGVSNFTNAAKVSLQALG